jgi:hypothetical protein
VDKTEHVQPPWLNTTLSPTRRPPFALVPPPFTCQPSGTAQAGHICPPSEEITVLLEGGVQDVCSVVNLRYCLSQYPVYHQMPVLSTTRTYSLCRTHRGTLGCAHRRERALRSIRSAFKQARGTYSLGNTYPPARESFCSLWTQGFAGDWSSLGMGDSLPARIILSFGRSGRGLRCESPPPGGGDLPARPRLRPAGR